MNKSKQSWAPLAALGVAITLGLGSYLLRTHGVWAGEPGERAAPDSQQAASPNEQTSPAQASQTPERPDVPGDLGKTKGPGQAPKSSGTKGPSPTQRIAAWKTEVVRRAAEINPRVPQYVAMDHTALSPASHAPDEQQGAMEPASHAPGEQEVEECVFKVLRASSDQPARVRQVALWIVQHDPATAEAIPFVSEEPQLLEEARETIERAGLSSTAYRVFRTG